MSALLTSSDSTQKTIHHIFTERRTYTIPEAAALFGMEEGAIREEIAGGELTAERSGSETVLPWADVAYLALRTWPLERIFASLGEEEAACLPELLRPATLTAVVPAYQARMLEVLAERRGLDVSTFLQLHLLGLASDEAPLLDACIPGFVRAFQFPYRE
jgi:hypothetical protein